MSAQRTARDGQSWTMWPTPTALRVAVWVAVHHGSAPSREDRPRRLVQFEPIGTAVPRAASAVGLAGRCQGEECGKLQINRLFCKPICKPDAARQRGKGETEPTERDVTRPVRRGHRNRERLPETAETRVVWLITQRSRVQIPPPLQRQRPFLEQREGLLHVG